LAWIKCHFSWIFIRPIALSQSLLVSMKVGCPSLEIGCVSDTPFVCATSSYLYAFFIFANVQGGMGSVFHRKACWIILSHLIFGRWHKTENSLKFLKSWSS
jgi:hypothetical protein